MPDINRKLSEADPAEIAAKISKVIAPVLNSLETMFNRLDAKNLESLKNNLTKVKDCRKNIEAIAQNAENNNNTRRFS